MKKQDLHLFGITKEEDDTNPKEWNWEYYQANKIPYILVSIMDDKELSHIKIDLDTISDELFFENSADISRIWHKFHMDYCDKSQMPDDKSGVQEDELRDKIWDKKFRKKPITGTGRAIAFKQ